jgi:hypothetical protein
VEPTAETRCSKLSLLGQGTVVSCEGRVVVVCTAGGSGLWGPGSWFLLSGGGTSVGHRRSRCMM